jgi:hypothetical protein
MKRYYFDLREGDTLAVDEEGLELPTLQLRLRAPQLIWQGTQFGQRPIRYLTTGW